MILRSDGIVLHQIKYRDNGLIVKIYTKERGLLSFIVQGFRKGSKQKKTHYQPLSLLLLDFYHKDKQSLHRIKEARITKAFHSIQTDVVKNCIAIFMAEVLYHSIKEEQPNPSLYQFIENHLLFLEEAEDIPTDFHLYFMLLLTQHLGFYPDNSDTGAYFNPDEGCFASLKKPSCFNREESQLIRRLLDATEEGPSNEKFPMADRRLLLNLLIRYYQAHQASFNELKSPAVLAAVLS